MDAAGKLQLSLNLPLPGIRTSLLTLTVAADDVAFVVNRSPAEVVKVEVRWAAGARQERHTKPSPAAVGVFRCTRARCTCLATLHRLPLRSAPTTAASAAALRP